MNCWQRFFGQPSLSVFCLMPFVLFMKPPPAHAAHYGAIYTFKGPMDGNSPIGPLVADSQGNLYGVTFYGGAYGNGTVFMLSPPDKTVSTWNETILHSFTGGADGSMPDAGLVIGADGSIYGTTRFAGSELGAVFKIANAPGWPLTILHTFDTNGAGGLPNSRLVFGANGLLYGTTLGNPTGGVGPNGTVFDVSPQGDQVEFRTIAAFNNASPGVAPVGLTLVPAGAVPGFNGFSGTFSGGFADSYGALFAQQVLAGGGGPNAVIYPFSAQPNVWLPNGPPIVGGGALKGMLVGTGCIGGSENMGGVFQVTPAFHSTSGESVLYSFGSQANDGSGCSYIIQENLAGRLAGVSTDGGAYGDGTFFELIPPAQPGGVWTEHIDVSFESSNKFGGGNPEGAPLHLNGHYYGVLTIIRGGQGAVYELTP